MTEPIQELGAEARAALQALKAEQTLRPSRHRSVLRRIESSVQTGAAAPGGRTDILMREPSDRAPIPAWTWAVAAAAVIAIAIWGLQTATSTSARHDPRSNPGAAPYEIDDDRPEHGSQAVRPQPVPRSVPAPVAEPAQQPVDSAPTAAPHRAARRPAVKVEPATVPPQPRLADEMALMRKAQASLERADPAGALRALDEHAREHANRQLVEDRQALQIIALCKMDRVDQARTKAAAFARSFPQSHYKKRIAACLENTQRR